MRTSIGKLKWHDKTIKLFQGINDDFLLRWFYHKHTETASTCTAYLARNGSCLSCHLKGLFYDRIGLPTPVPIYGQILAYPLSATQVSYHWHFA
jgi:hypothetical protein